MPKTLKKYHVIISYVGALAYDLHKIFWIKNIQIFMKNESLYTSCTLVRLPSTVNVITLYIIINLYFSLLNSNICICSW